MRIDQSGQQKLIKVLLTIFLSLAVAVGVFTVVAFSIINGAKEIETNTHSGAAKQRGYIFGLRQQPHRRLRKRRGKLVFGKSEQLHG